MRQEKGDGTLSRKKDLDYLTISARIHAMETRLLNAERVERMIEARELSEAAKVLTECGYGDMGQVTEGPGKPVPRFEYGGGKPCPVGRVSLP